MLVLEHIAWNLPDGEPILKDITLTVPDGKLAVVTGPNGGGKTSLAKLIAGLEKPAAGRILLDGEDITGLDITQRAKKGVAYAFQQRYGSRDFRCVIYWSWLPAIPFQTRNCVRF